MAAPCPLALPNGLARLVADYRAEFGCPGIARSPRLAVPRLERGTIIWEEGSARLAGTITVQSSDGEPGDGRGTERTRLATAAQASSAACECHSVMNAHALLTPRFKSRMIRVQSDAASPAAERFAHADSAILLLRTATRAFPTRATPLFFPRPLQT